MTWVALGFKDQRLGNENPFSSSLARHMPHPQPVIFKTAGTVVLALYGAIAFSPAVYLENREERQESLVSSNGTISPRSQRSKVEVHLQIRQYFRGTAILALPFFKLPLDEGEVNEALAWVRAHYLHPHAVAEAEAALSALTDHGIILLIEDIVIIFHVIQLHHPFR